MSETGTPRDADADARQVLLRRVRGTDVEDAWAGVPMVLALIDETGTEPPPAPPGSPERRRGEAVAADLERAGRLLAPGRDDGDTRMLHTLLTVAGADATRGATGGATQ